MCFLSSCLRGEERKRLIIYPHCITHSNNCSLQLFLVIAQAGGARQVTHCDAISRLVCYLDEQDFRGIVPSFTVIMKQYSVAESAV